MTEPIDIDFSAVASVLGLETRCVIQTMALLDAGNTVPFVTRYRKEQTGNLDEEQIRAIQKEVHTRRQIAERAQAVLRLIESQGALTDELKQSILQADSLKRLEDLYLPYRPKRQSRATLARENGLQPLAERIWSGECASESLEAIARVFVTADGKVENVEAALQGAADILAERIGEDAEFRQHAREIAWKSGRFIVSAVKNKTGESPANAQEFRNYFDYKETVATIPPHRMLAVNRGEKEGILKVKIEWDQESSEHWYFRKSGFGEHPCSNFLLRCLRDAIDRFIGPSLERELRRETTESAEIHAVGVFARNLRNLLLQPPLRGKTILAVDPGFRTGCKLAVIDECGKCLAHDVIYVTGSEEKRKSNIEKLVRLIREYGCQLSAIGNGTACRETEELISEAIADHCPDLRYVIVNEAGASIYSTSSVAREEFPDRDATVRGTISIGRRLVDPLSELVKIDPQHLGVGLYQHDVTPKLLQESLEEVIESCVNFVGVDLNTASVSLLKRVSGLNQLIARRILEWREAHGRFRSREQLNEVSGIGEAKFTQAAGFLKIRNGDVPLDSTWIHPESYEDARKILELLELSPEHVLEDESLLPGKLDQIDRDQLAAQLHLSRLKLDELLSALMRPDHDPRGDLADPVFKQGVLRLDDLQLGMELSGTVLNVVDFGAFVDVGLKESGLVHVSQLSTRFVQSPHDVVGVGDRVRVWVHSIDTERKRVALSMISPAETGKQQAVKDRTPTASTEGPPRTEQENLSPPKPKRKRRKRGGAAKPVPIVEKGQTLRGFDELKSLWNQKRKKPR
ncbi:MAG TPA: Tex family protein [Planctomycetaceae bacterium]|nr:Tex family protein [Planctomycetaceae bacterium]